MSVVGKHRKETADAVREEARRLLTRIDQWEKATGDDPGHYPSPEWATVFRSSMDLTRALAELRRNPYERANR